MIKDIIQAPNDALLKVCAPVDLSGADAFLALQTRAGHVISDLIDTRVKHKAVGLAAPQIGHALRLDRLPHPVGPARAGADGKAGNDRRIGGARKGHHVAPLLAGQHLFEPGGRRGHGFALGGQIRIVRPGAADPHIGRRQRLGKAYSPRVMSERSRPWTGYGTLSVWTGVDVKDVAAARAAINQAIAGLRAHKISPDILERARRPLAENYQNELKTNGGWLAVAARAQSRPDAVERQMHARDRALAVTAADVLAAARRYLAPEAAVAVTVLPLKSTPGTPPPGANLSQHGDTTMP